MRGLRVSEDFFRVLGVYPALGRVFSTDEDKPGGERVAIMSDGLWRRRFGADPALLGSTVLLNDKPVTIVGIMPPEFRFGADLFVPMRARPTANYDPNATVIGRLKPGVTIAQARAELETVADNYRAAFPQQMQPGESVGAQSYKETFTGDVSQLLWILFSAGWFPAADCVRERCEPSTHAQRREAKGNRRAAGPRRESRRIIRQLITEGVLLALIGGVAGILLAIWGTDLLVASVPQDLLPSVAVISVDWRVMLFALRRGGRHRGAVRSGSGVAIAQCGCQHNAKRAIGQERLGSRKIAKRAGCG